MWERSTASGSWLARAGATWAARPGPSLEVPRSHASPAPIAVTATPSANTAGINGNRLRAGTRVDLVVFMTVPPLRPGAPPAGTPDSGTSPTSLARDVALAVGA